jgi:hypothetical protein
MTEMSFGVTRGEFLYLNREELDRARRRIEEPAWRRAAEQLRAEADKLLSGGGPSGTYDCSWYDAQPDRDFFETYTAFGNYVRPAMATANEGIALLRAGVLFGDDRYLERGRQLAMHVADHFKFHVQQHDAGLCYSYIASFLAEAANVLHERLSDDERSRLHRQMEACGEAILHNTRHWLTNLARMPYNNHLAAHRCGILALGLVLGRSDWVDQAIDGVRGFGDMVVGAVMDDGLCYESSTGYHYQTLHCLMTIAELVRHQPRLGRDLYRETFANGRSLKQMFDAPLGLLQPNGELPAIGDCYANREPLWATQARFYEIAFAVYGDPRYAWLLQRGGERICSEALFLGVDRLEPAEPPPSRSRIWVEHGYALLASRTGRDYWDIKSGGQGAGLVAVLVGHASGIHNHNDKLSLLVSGAGRIWIEDIESQDVEGHGVVAPIRNDFNRTMLAHNLVVVDETDQQKLSTPLRIAEFRELPSCSTVTMVDAEARLYPGVRMARTVVVTPDYCLDVFQAASDLPRTYDWLLHPRSERPVTAGLEFTPTTLPDRTPYSFLRNPAVATVGQAGVALEWSQAEDRFRADVTAWGTAGKALGGEVIRAEWPVKSDWSAGGREMFMFRVRGHQVTFVAIHRERVSERTCGVASVERRFNGQWSEIHVVTSDGLEKRRSVFQEI